MSILSILLFLATLTVQPHFGFSPLTIRIDIRPMGYNKAMCVTVDNPAGEFHRSCWGQTPKLRTVTYTLYDVGEYTITLTDADGTRAMASVMVLE